MGLHTSKQSTGDTMTNDEMIKIEHDQMIGTITLHYLICALWASSDDDGRELDYRRDISDIAPETRAQARQDVEDFVGLLQREGINWQDAMSPEQFGHDFWLTRNGHGAGFWDRGLDALGDTLTKWADTFKAVDMYVGDDGKVYA